jgi:predicted nucleic acid-binding Zn ribbon protein
LKWLKDEVIQLRTRKRQLTHMLVSLSVVIIILVGVWLMGRMAMH